MTRVRGTSSRDAGASLIIVLVFLALFGTWVAAVVGFSATALKTSARVQEQGGLTYAVDAAAETAIDTVRASSYVNDAGQQCFGSASGSELAVPAINGSGALRVHCDADGSTGGAATGVPINASNRPGQAILTTSTSSSEQGLFMDAGNTIRVKGKIISNSTITASGSSSLVNENSTVRARSTCTPTPSTPNSPTDRIRGVADSTGDGVLCGTGIVTATPTYTQPSGPLQAQSLPPYSCSAGTVVNLQPGFYDNATTLSTLTACPVTVILGTGTFYFDFTATSSKVWEISNTAALVVTGTPTWNTGSSSRPPVVSTTSSGKPVYVPGACKTPLDSTANGGSRLVFGGDSQLLVNAGQFEACGPYLSTAPPIAVWGATSAIGTSSIQSANGLSMTPLSGAVAPSGPPTFTNPNNLVPGDANAVASVAGLSANTSAVVTVGGFAATPAIPAGATLQSANLVLNYRTETIGNGSNTARVALTAAVTPNGGGSTGAKALPPNVSGTLTSSTVDVLADLVAGVQANGWTGAKVTLTATENANLGAKAFVDSITLNLTYTTPSLRAQTGCVTSVGYPSVGTCAFLKSLGAQSFVYVQGTTFAPNAAVDLQVANSSGQVFRSGIIARVLRMQLPANPGAAAVIEVPGDSTGTATALSAYFTVYECPSTTPCATGGTKRLRTRVTFSVPAATPRTASVDWWRILR